MKNANRISLVVILASGTLTVMTGSVISPVVNLMRQGLGASASSVGVVITTHSLFLAISSPLMGSVIDRKGIKGPLVAGLLLYGLAGGAGVCIDHFWLLLVSRAILGVALASFFAATSTLILNRYEERQRIRVMGWHSSAQSLGGVVWPVVGGLLGGFSWHMPFAVYLLAIPIGVVAAIGVPSGGGPSTGGAAGRGGVFGIFRGNPVLLVVFGLMFYLNFHLYTLIIYLPQLLEGCDITNAFHLSLFIAGITVASGTLSLVYWRFREKLSYRVMVTTAVAIDAGAFFLITGCDGILAIAAAVALFGMGMAFIFPTCFLWVGDLVPSSFRGRFSAYLLMTAFAAQFAVPILLAPVVAAHGIRAVFFTGLCASLLTLALLGLFWRWMSAPPMLPAAHPGGGCPDR